MLATLETDTSAFDALIDRLTEETDPSRAGPMQDGMLAASNVYHAAMRARFAAASARDGTWAEHAPSTIARRGPGAPILIETGQLEESLGRDGTGHVLEFDGDALVEGTTDRTAIFHQAGTEHIPERAILVEPEAETLDDMGKRLAAAVARTARNPRIAAGNDDLSDLFDVELI